MNDNKQQVNHMNEIEKIQIMCGELCKTSRVGHSGLFFHKTTGKVNCKLLFRTSMLIRTMDLTCS